MKVVIKVERDVLVALVWEFGRLIHKRIGHWNGRPRCVGSKITRSPTGTSGSTSDSRAQIRLDIRGHWFVEKRPLDFPSCDWSVL